MITGQAADVDVPRFVAELGLGLRIAPLPDNRPARLVDVESFVESARHRLAAPVFDVVSAC